MGHDATAHGPDDGTGDAARDSVTTNGPGGECDHLRDLAARVRAEGVVRLQVDGEAVVCVSAAAWERARPVPVTTDAPDAVAPALSHVHRRILHLIHRGLTASEVADVLDVDLRTLTHHLTDIRGRYGVTSTREAVRRAVDGGALPVVEH